MKKYVWTVVILILLTPLGLLADGTAWGEWGTDEIVEIVGFVPQGMANFPIEWNAIFPDYSLEWMGETFMMQAFSYMLAALVGTALIMTVFMGFKSLIPSQSAHPHEK